MAACRLTPKAADDLAERPALGRRADRLAPGLRRYPYRSHVVFYMPEDEGVLIVRVLHESMDALRHFAPPSSS